DPRRPLRLRVHRAVDGEGRVGQGVVVIAAEHAVLVDGELEDVVGFLLVALHHGEDAERLPLLLLVRFRSLPRGGEGQRLGGVLLGGGDRLAVVEDGVVLVDQIGTVVVDHRQEGVGAKGGDGGVRRPPPVARRRPRGRAPGTGVGHVPAGVEIVVAGKAGAHVAALRAYRRRASITSVVADGAGDGNAARRGGVRAKGAGRGAPVRGTT